MTHQQQTLVNEKKAKAQELRAQAEAIYHTAGHTLGEALQALEWIYQASVIERELGIPPQTQATGPIRQQIQRPEITEEQREECERAHIEYIAREEQKTENRKQARKEQAEPPRPGFKPMPAQLNLF